MNQLIQQIEMVGEKCQCITQQEWQIFVVSDVLQLSDNDSTRFVIECAIVPLRIDALQFGSQIIVVTGKDCVQGRQRYLHVGPTVTCFKTLKPQRQYRTRKRKQGNGH